MIPYALFALNAIPAISYRRDCVTIQRAACLETADTQIPKGPESPVTVDTEAIPHSGWVNAAYSRLEPLTLGAKESRPEVLELMQLFNISRIDSQDLVSRITLMPELFGHLVSVLSVVRSQFPSEPIILRKEHGGSTEDHEALIAWIVTGDEVKSVSKKIDQIESQALESVPDQLFGQIRVDPYFV